MYFIQCSTIASEGPQVRTWGRQSCFLPRAPFNLVMPLYWMQACATQNLRATECYVGILQFCSKQRGIPQICHVSVWRRKSLGMSLFGFGHRLNQACTTYGPRELSCRKYCKSTTSDNYLSFQNFFHTTTK